MAAPPYSYPPSYTGLQQFLNSGSVSVPGTIPISQSGTPFAVGTTLAASGSIVSAVFPSNGLCNASIGINVSHAGTLLFDRYIGPDIAFPAGTTISQALTAATAATIEINDGKAWGAGRLTLINSAGAASTITALEGVLQKV